MIEGSIGSTSKACSGSTNIIGAGTTATSADVCSSACGSDTAMVSSETGSSGPAGGVVDVSGVLSGAAEVLGLDAAIPSKRAFFFWFHFSLAESRALDKRILDFLQLL